MNEHKQRFAKVRAALDRVKSLFKKAPAPSVRSKGYSGDRSRPYVERETDFVHVSRPLITNREGEVTGVAEKGTTYVRPELRRHELRKLKKQGLDLTGSTGTRAMEKLL